LKTAYKYRMYPNREQEAQLEQTLDTCRHLYNTALADRKNAYELEGISRSYEDQARMLTAEKKDGNFNGVFSQVFQDVLRRLDKSFKAFFRRVKAGEKDGAGFCIKAKGSKEAIAALEKLLGEIDLIGVQE